jgi:hypothetical protein
MPSYREQYDRMYRWYEKFSSLDRGRNHEIPSDNYVDEIYAFFQNAYHLKDWIKNDPTVPPIIGGTVEIYITECRPLRLCADICNSLKHLTLTRGRSDENPSFGHKAYSLSIGGGPTTIKLKYEVNTDLGQIDAFELATSCVKAWDDFFASHLL